MELYCYGVSHSKGDLVTWEDNYVVLHWSDNLPGFLLYLGMYVFFLGVYSSGIISESALLLFFLSILTLTLIFFSAGAGGELCLMEQSV